MSDDLRQRYAEALANAECEKQPRCVNCMADSVMAVRDEELERTRRELEKVLCQQVWDAMTDEADGEVARLRYELEQWHAAYGKPVLPETLARLWEWRERAEQAETKVLAYESADSYVTSCTSCAGHLDRERRQEERAETAEAAIARVRAAHPMVDDGYGPECRGCGNPAAGIVSWPCPTIAALDSQSPNVEPERPAGEERL